ncbi:MAG: helix-turn-helix domain-containing protein [Brumimicrobium sp.]
MSNKTTILVLLQLFVWSGLIGQSSEMVNILTHLERSSSFLGVESDSVLVEVETALQYIDETIDDDKWTPEQQDTLIKYKIRAHLIQGIRLKNLQEFHASFKVYKTALKLAEKYNSQYQKMMALNNIAIIYNEIGEKELRDQYFKTALEVSNEMQNYNEQKTLPYNLALFCIEEGKYNKGLQIYEPIYKKAKKEKDSLYIAAYWSLKSNIFAEQNKISQAIQAGEKCLNFSQKDPNNYFVLTTEIDLIRLYTRFGDYKKAENLIEKEFYQEKLDEIDRLSLERLKVMAELYDVIDKEEKAKEIYSKYYKIRDSLKVEEEYKNTLKEGLLEKFNSEKRKDSLLQLKQQNILKNQALKKESETRYKWTVFTGVLIILFLLILYYLFRQYRRNKKRMHQLAQEKELLAQDQKKLKDRLLDLSSLNKEKKVTSPKKYALSSLTDKKREELLKDLLNFMLAEKPYLNPHYSLKELARDTDISTHHISEVLNVAFNKNFYEFINIYRVETAKKLMKTNKDGKEKLLSICFDAGFNSRATFNRVFKNIVGETPSAYQKKTT